MSEENDKTKEQKIEKVSPPSVAMTRRGFDPQTIEEAWRFADALSRSSLVPSTYQGKPGDCIIALDLAARLDAPWLAIMQHVYTVHGRPAMDAALCTALVNRSNRFVDPIEYQVEGELATNTDGEYRVRAYATCSRTRKVLYGPWINWPLVKAEGWNQRAGWDGTAKTNKWNTMPEQMFHYRAATWFQRRYCPEITLGMLSVEEAEELPEKPIHVESTDITTEKGVNGMKARLAAKTQSPAPLEKEPVTAGNSTDQPIAEPVVEGAEATTSQAFNYRCQKCNRRFITSTMQCIACGGTLKAIKHRRTKAEIEAQKAAEGKEPITTPNSNHANQENAPEEATEANSAIVQHRCLNPRCKSKGKPFSEPLVGTVKNLCPFCLSHIEPPAAQQKPKRHRRTKSQANTISDLTYCPYCKTQVPENEVAFTEGKRCHLACGYELLRSKAEYTKALKAQTPRADPLISEMSES